MKILSYIAFAVAGIGALLAAAAAFVVATVDPNRYKGEIEHIVKEKKNRTLAIEGDLVLSFWPSLGIDFGRATLSEHAADTEFAAIEHAHLSVALMPLLSKRVVVEDVRLEGVTATLIRDKDGRFNFDDLLAAEDKSMLRLDIASLKLRGGQLTLRDRQTGRIFNLRDIDATTGRLGNAGDGPFAVKFNVASAAPKLIASVNLEGSYRYDLGKKNLSLSGLNLNIAGDAPGLQGLDCNLAAGKLESTSGAYELVVEELRFAARAKTGADDFEVTLDAPRFSVASGKARSEPVVVAARLSGVQRAVNAKAKLSGIAASAAALNIADVRLDLEMRQGDLAVKGELGSPLAADFPARTCALPKLAGEITLAHPQMPAQRMRLGVAGGVRADLANAAALGEMSAKFDQSSVDAKWNLSQFAPPVLEFGVDIDRIDLDRYLPSKRARSKAAATGVPIDLTAIDDLNANGIVRIGTLQLNGAKSRNVRLSIRSAGGKLAAAPAAARP